MNNINNNLENYLLVFTDCVVVNGEKYSVIQDLTRRAIHKIPRSYAEIIPDFKKQNLGAIKKRFTSEEWKEFEKFVFYLLEKKVATFVNDTSFFPEIELVWNQPNILTNAIIDFKIKYSKYSIDDVLSQLSNLECKHVEIRTYSEYSLDFIYEVIKYAENTLLSSIEIIFREADNQNLDEINNIFENNHIINKITLTHSKENKITEVNRGYISIAHLIQTTQEVDSQKKCGIISEKNLFIPGIAEFAENHNYNSCLNRKISVDIDGEIKNCPSMKLSYGNIMNKELKQVVLNLDFKKLWTISKNEISICKSCEFRYMCTDCRAFTQNPKDILSKPLKCGYSPENGEWSDWMKNEISEIGITYYEF